MNQFDDTIIKVENLTMFYDGVPVQKDLNFEVRRGEIFVILGGSGCGKSTLLKHMIGLYRTPQGRIYIEGDDIVNAEGENRLRLLQKIGVMYQNGALFGSMNLLENVCVPLEEFTTLPEKAREQIACVKLSLVGLEPYAKYMPSEISGGMIKRAAIARAMALDPKILFLDEPSAGLDPITSAELDNLIVQLSKLLNITFVIVTHELASIYSIADRVIMLDKKAQTIIATGKPSELRDNCDIPMVRHFFHREVENDVVYDEEA